MKVMIILVVIVALVGQTMAETVPDVVETLVKHSAGSEKLSPEQLLTVLDDQMNFMELVEHDVPISEWVAGLLYDTADKEQTVVLNGVTVAKLIKQNTIQLADCNQEGFKKRTGLIDTIKPSNKEEADTGVVYGINVYALRCLHLAADFCLRNEDSVTKQGVSDDKFMAGLRTAQSKDSQTPEPDESFDESLVYSGIISMVERYIAETPTENVV